MIINKKSETDLSGFYIVYRGSVLNENTTNYGISHLLEHLCCKQFKHLYNDFERYSISWNAYTGNNEVVFHMKGLDEYLNKYRQPLLDSLLKFSISENEFEKEKMVVIQEYKDTFQDQSTSSYYNLLRKVYQNYGPIGKLESLEKITLQDANEYWKKYLSKPSLIINVSKHNDYIGFDNFMDTHPPKFEKSSDDVIVYERMVEFSKSSVSGFIKTEDDMAYIDFVLDMLSKSLESPLSKEIREKRGLTYGVGAFISRISDDEGLIITSLVTTDDKVDEVLDVYKMVLSNPKKYLTEERFSTIKDYYIVKKKKDKINLYSNVHHLIEPEGWEIQDIIDDITYEKSVDIFNKYLSYDKWTWVVDKTEYQK